MRSTKENINNQSSMNMNNSSSFSPFVRGLMKGFASMTILYIITFWIILLTAVVYLITLAIVGLSHLAVLFVVPLVLWFATRLLLGIGKNLLRFSAPNVPVLELVVLKVLMWMSAAVAAGLVVFAVYTEFL